MGNTPPEKLDDRKPRVRSVGSGVLPADICSVVAEYLSDDSSNYVKAALLGVQPITLCLLQSDDCPGFAEALSLGFVSPEHRWVPKNFRRDKIFLIKDQEACLHFLEQTNLNYCPVAIEVLSVRLTMYNYFCGNALDDLVNTIIVLQSHLKSIKHVVIQIEHNTCCIFSFKDAIDTVHGAPKLVDKCEALFEIIDDLKTCWQTDYLTLGSVFAFYFKSSVPRTSEKYLSKFICHSEGSGAKEILKEEALGIASSKIMWILNVEEDTFWKAPPEYTRLCRAVDWDGPYIPTYTKKICKSSKDAFCYRDNPFVERIIIDCLRYGQAIKLPRPSTPLTDATPRSALIELTLEGHRNVIHLTDLNNGYFPNLRHLSIIYGGITGHLDSHRVPLLKTLRIEPGCDHGHSPSFLYGVVREHAQSLIDAGHPWQLVATQTNGGWSLASYDEPISNPQDEVKENSTFSGSSLHELPRIRELLLVVSMQEHADEWQSQLKGFPSLEAAVDGHKDSILVWEPQCVEKITVFCTNTRINRQFKFTEAIPEQECILNSLRCYNVGLVIDGAAVPHLQLLKVNQSEVTMSGAFPSLQTLSLESSKFLSPWQVDAPLLQSLDCCELMDGHHLSLCPKWLPQLSSLRVTLWKFDPNHSPVILDDKGALGFSHVKHVVFGKSMVRSRYFDQCQASSVSDLVISVNVLQLPACWLKEVWQCKQLTINAHGPLPDYSKSMENPIEVRLPFCPRVRTLTVTEENCRVLLNEGMPNLTVCSLPSPKSLGRCLHCPALKRIRFTEKLSDIEKMLCLDRATYVAIGAQPSEIIFAADYELHTMVWNDDPIEHGMLPLDGPL